MMMKFFYYVFVRPALFLLRLVFLPVKLFCRLFSWILSKISKSWAFRHADLDAMDGWEFEEYAAQLLRWSGFHHVEVTRGSGDQGVDILAMRDERSYAVQCKHYAGKVPNKAVQEAYAGAQFYGCDVGWSCGTGILCDGWCGGSSERKMKRVSLKRGCSFVYACACFFLCIVYICIIIIRKRGWLRGNAEIED